MNANKTIEFTEYYKKKWQELEAAKPRPDIAKKITEISFEDFKGWVFDTKESRRSELVERVFSGESFVLKNTFSTDFVSQIKESTQEFWASKPSEFHKIIDGAPDFHRVIDENAAALYNVYAVKHSLFTFPWNDDPLKAHKKLWDHWGVFKVLGGFHFDEYVSNLPSHGRVDRFQVIHYPRGAGVCAEHADPYKTQRFVISVFLSKRGEEYHHGGFYVRDENNNKLDVESHVDLGDMFFCYATIRHGVELIDPEAKPDWSGKTGRWYIGLYSVESNMVSNREEWQKK